MEGFTYEAVAGLVNQQVVVIEPAGGRELTQLEIERVESNRRHLGYESFSVELRGDPARHCPGGNYIIKHPAFGEPLLFMSPYAVDRYQILVSTLTDNG